MKIDYVHYKGKKYKVVKIVCEPGFIGIDIGNNIVVSSADVAEWKFFQTPADTDIRYNGLSIL